MTGKLIAYRAAMSVGAPLLSLALIEAVLRLATTGSVYLTETNPHFLDAYGVVRLRPNQNVWWYGDHYQTNSSGFRMVGDVGTKRGLRIVALGDSVTLGMGVRNNEDVWPNRLEVLLHARGQSATEVINTGVQGWDLMKEGPAGSFIPGEYRRFVEGEGASLSPDIVVYCICLNDVPSQAGYAYAMDNDRNRARFTLFPERMREWLKRKACYRLLRDSYREARFHSLDFSAVLAAQQRDGFWQEVSRELALLKESVERRHGRLYCVVVPFSFQILPANGELLKVNEQWHACLQRNGIPWTDITRRLSADSVLDYYSLGDYVHLNERGHELIAEEALSLILPGSDGP